MGKRFTTWLITFCIFLAVDLVWLGVVAQPLYNKYLGDFLADSPLWGAALLFYALFVVGLQYFAIEPALSKSSKGLALKNGALFGFFTYMTYELTNYAVLADWPSGIVLIDIAWGTILGGLVAYISTTLLLKKGRKK